MAPLSPQEAANSRKLPPVEQKNLEILMTNIDDSLETTYLSSSLNFVYTLSPDEFIFLRCSKKAFLVLKESYQNNGWSSVLLEEQSMTRVTKPYLVFCPKSEE